jgi:hypothetical protein
VSPLPDPDRKPSVIQRFFAALVMAFGVLPTLLGGTCVIAAVNFRGGPPGLGMISAFFGAPILIFGLVIIGVGIFLWRRRV